MADAPELQTSLCYSNADRVEVRGHDLCNDLMGEVNFGDFIFMHITGRRPDAGESILINTILVAMVEHGMTPSAIAARLTYLGSPEAMQAAMASGLLGAGSVFLGAVEDAARMLHEGVARWQEQGGDLAAFAVDLLQERRRQGLKLPGYGHNLHKAGDPRARRLLHLARTNGKFGVHCQMADALATAVGQSGRPLPMNIMAAIGAVALDLGIDWRTVKGFPLISRAAGLVAHLTEEVRHPSARTVWGAVEEMYAYRP